MVNKLPPLAGPVDASGEPLKGLQERVDATVAQLLLEIAFLLPIGTNVRQHPIAQKLLDCVKAVREHATAAAAVPSSPAQELEQFKATWLTTDQPTDADIEPALPLSSPVADSPTKEK